MGIKIISFSLWGNKPKYCIGAIRNAELAPEIYPGWECVFQLDYSVPQNIEDILRNMDHVRVERRIDPKTRGVAAGDWRGMFWRFELACAQGVEVMLSRDCDSRLGHREAFAVREWLEGDKGFHVMHDHPYHTVPMLGGMWGCRGFALPTFNNLMAAWPAEDRLQTDQEFLSKEIWPRIQGDVLNHDEFFRHLWGGKPFPVPRRGTEFVGQVFDENEVTVTEHIAALAKVL